MKGFIMVKIDCLGLICPLPLMKVKSNVHLLNEEDVLVFVVDHSCAVSNISEFCRLTNLLYHVEEPLNGIWEIYVSR